MTEIIERPQWHEYMGSSNRALVRLWRRQSAWDMAHMVNEQVTQAEYDKAYDLLNRCTRWAIAQMRHDEREDSTNFNKPWYVHEGELLYARMERLENELRAYGCGIACCGYFCQNVYQFDFENHTITSYGLLHFFDY